MNSARRSRPPSLPAAPQPAPKRVTLDRLLSKLGVASRRAAQDVILAGRVRLNGRVVRESETWVTWPGDALSIDDHPVQAPDKRFILFHKPKGVVTTHRDEKGRKTIFDVLPPELRGLHAVGRLDQATSGLLLLTNDSTWSAFLTDPRHRIPRVYLVTVRGLVTDATCRAALAGVIEDGERLHCADVRLQKSSRRESHLEVTLMEGKNREIRRLFNALAHEVTRLRRIRYGPFALGDLPPGAWRDLPMKEAMAALV